MQRRDTYTIVASDTLGDVVNAINKSGIANASVDANGLLSVTGTGSDALSVNLGATSGTPPAFTASSTDTTLLFGTLNESKGLLPHGRFLAWLRLEFDWPERTAQRYMRIARVLGDKTATVSDLSLRAMDALTARSTPEGLRDELLDELAAGKAPSNRDLVARVKASRRAAAADDVVSVDDEVPSLASPEDAGRRAAAFIRERLIGDLVELRRLLARADAATLLAGLQQGAC